MEGQGRPLFGHFVEKSSENEYGRLRHPKLDGPAAALFEESQQLGIRRFIEPGIELTAQLGNQSISCEERALFPVKSLRLAIVEVDSGWSASSRVAVAKIVAEHAMGVEETVT